jgi:hypothetical protein
MSDEIDRLFPQFINDINLLQPDYSVSDRVFLRGSSTSRMAETIRIALACLIRQ